MKRRPQRVVLDGRQSWGDRTGHLDDAFGLEHRETSMGYMDAPSREFSIFDFQFSIHRCGTTAGYAIFNLRSAVVAALITVAACALPCPPVAAAEEEGWPREIQVEGGAVIVYQPQIDSFSGDVVDARAAVMWRPKDGSEPLFGAVWTTARVEVDRENRLVDFVDIKVPQVRFPAASDEQQQQLAELLEREAPAWDLEISLDRFIAGMDVLEGGDQLDHLRNDPPKILVSYEPAVLISIDGRPKLQAVENSSLQRVVNTPYLMLFDPMSNAYYLSSDETWFSAREIEGPWRVEKNPPEAVLKLTPAEPEAQRQVEPEEPDERVPRVVVAFEPSELIVIDGQPDWLPVEGNQLLYVDNTDSDVLMEIGSQRYFVLLSGRWYRATSLDGPWEFVPFDELPASFAEIPAEADVGYLRAHVAGTEEAREAVLDNYIPQTAAVRRDATIEVSYDGQPKFEAIDGTEMAYAANTDKSVIKIGDRYYCCEQGVWYVADAPTGPWKVSDHTPENVDEIPPSSPVYNTRYVYVYDTTPEVVYVGYTPAYMGSYYWGGCVVYGTGWYYRPWYASYYYPRPSTWGFHVRYNPWYGWSFGVSWSNGPFTFSFGTGGYHGGWWGPGWYRPYPYPYYRAGYHAGYWHGYYHGSQRGQVGRPSQLPAGATRPAAVPARNIYARPGNTDRVATTRDRAPAPSTLAETRPNNVLTDRSGNVYRHNQDGTWDRRDPGGWNRADPPKTSDRARPSQMPAAGERPSTGSRPSQLPSAGARPSTGSRPSQLPSTRPSLGGSGSVTGDYGARQRGAARSQQFHTTRPSAGARPAPRRR